ncbi:NADP-dependent L-serine/L-allo-threonine dehydrogenase ydfG [Ascobolus immersus RN42]|uniref:NADP-dependent L-serine/L-allo-threonine dehydrogenase ydfG n=1 Tax=Ascobolus immersus RN42 TaxID=1160509 RepID=A0A3N4IKS0_ASCIM|nr:NADP-dependent L-serine/L-allo-threonine dehydrogenase ydfG [Ascobolus immersus RN42]
MPLRQTVRTFTSLPFKSLFSNTSPTFTSAYTRTMSAFSSAAAQRLAGKTILVTGASAGIGKATALEFAKTSPSVNLILTARRVDALEKAKAEITALPGFTGSVTTYKLDVSNVDELALFETEVVGKHGLDVLVNNAGLVKGVEKVGEISQADIDVMYNTNVRGLIALSQIAVRHYKSKNGGRGDIVNLGSIAGREPYVGGSIYCSTKAAVRAFTDSLRRETIDTRIRIIEIDPGQVETEFSVVRFRGDVEAAKKVYEGCDPLTPEDIAEIAVFAVSRRENVVVADTLVFPSHQAGAGAVHRRS